jgi:epoxyqueuosine reductase
MRLAQDFQSFDPQRLARQLREWAHELGFSQIGIAGIDLTSAEAGLRAWLDAGCHGDMHYMAAHGLKRARPAELVPGTLSVISVRMPYLPMHAPDGWQGVEWRHLKRPRQAQVSLYARGRDYHKVLRARLQTLAGRLQAEVGPQRRVRHRAFTDSAPVLEVELASRAGVGWRGKHTLALHREGGSMFFLGELFVDLALPPTPPGDAHCGRCTACLDICPTRAIVAPYRLDARRCISYLTIELDGPIPEPLRAAIGNRIYGCDDCQLVCPWNKFAQRSALPDFGPRHGLDRAELLPLWAWREADFEQRLQGSAIRRIGWRRWRRNLAVALGNAWRATGDAALAQALQAARAGADALVAGHIDWALAQRPGGESQPRDGG